jgi:hypothetical protein
MLGFGCAKDANQPSATKTNTATVVFAVDDLVPVCKVIFVEVKQANSLYTIAYIGQS